MINKRFNTDTWSIRLISRDLCSLRLETPQGVLWLHNCYSRPPGNPRSVDFASPIHELEELLGEEEGEHLLLGDFNLHHPLWCGVRNPGTHDLAEVLIDRVSEKGMELLTPNGMITFAGRQGSSTIDLAFATPALGSALVQC